MVCYHGIVAHYTICIGSRGLPRWLFTRKWFQRGCLFDRLKFTRFYLICDFCRTRETTPNSLISLAFVPAWKSLFDSCEKMIERLYPDWREVFRVQSRAQPSTVSRRKKERGAWEPGRTSVRTQVRLCCIMGGNSNIASFPHIICLRSRRTVMLM